MPSPPVRRRDRYRVTGELIAASLLTGLLAGAGAVGFYYLSDYLGGLLLGLLRQYRGAAQAFLLPIYMTLGLGLVGFLLEKFPDARRGGVAEVLDSLVLQKGAIPLRRISNVILSGLVLAFGGSVGPEGPMVQLGALLGSVVEKRFKAIKDQGLTIVRAGAAAGIAAAFRSPAGGVLLTVELFGARFNQDLTATGIAASLGYLTRVAILGDAYPFRPPTAIEPLPVKALLTVVPMMGLLAAPIGHAFIRMFHWFHTLPPKQAPIALRVALGGFLVGIIGIWFPEVLAAGYPTIARGLHSNISLQLFLILLVLKMVATSITFGSGAVGGLFAPTLFIGAMYGGAFGYGLHRIFPQAVPQPELFVLLGMIVMFGSIVKGYWSGLLMIADMSGCYHQLLLPGVIAGGLASFFGWEIHAQSIFGLTRDPAKRAAAQPALSNG